TGISTAPATSTTTGVAAPEAFATSSAFSNIGSTTWSFHRVATIPTDSPEASTSYCSGRPSPLMRSPEKIRRWMSLRNAGQVVSHPVPFGAQIGDVVVGDETGHAHSFHDAHTVLFQGFCLGRVVGEQTYRGHPQLGEDLGPGTEFAGVRR